MANGINSAGPAVTQVPYAQPQGVPQGADPSAAGPQGGQQIDPSQLAALQAAAGGQSAQSSFDPNAMTPDQQAQLAQMIGAQVGAQGAQATGAAATAGAAGSDKPNTVSVPQDFVQTAAQAQKDSLLASVTDPYSDPMHKLMLLGALNHGLAVKNWSASNAKALQHMEDAEKAWAKVGAGPEENKAIAKQLGKAAKSVDLADRRNRLATGTTDSLHLTADEKSAIEKEAKGDRVKISKLSKAKRAEKLKAIKAIKAQRMTLRRSLRNTPIARRVGGKFVAGKLDKVVTGHEAALKGTEKELQGGWLEKLGAKQGKLLRNPLIGYRVGRGTVMDRSKTGKIVDKTAHGKAIDASHLKQDGKVFKLSEKAGKTMTSVSKKVGEKATKAKGGFLGRFFGGVKKLATGESRPEKGLLKYVSMPLRGGTTGVSKLIGGLARIPGVGKFAEFTGHALGIVAAINTLNDGKKALAIMGDPNASLKKKLLGCLTVGADVACILPQSRLSAGLLTAGASVGLSAMRDHSK